MGMGMGVEMGAWAVYSIVTSVILSLFIRTITTHYAIPTSMRIPMQCSTAI